MGKIGHNQGFVDEENESNSFFVSREVFEHQMFQAKPWCDGFAWLHLLSMASVETRRRINKGTIVILDPGDLMAAHGWLAEKWGWTVDKVRWFLRSLETEAMISRFCAKQDNRRHTNQIQIITICNYAKYQIIQEAQHQATEDNTRQHTSQNTRQNTRQNDNNINALGVGHTRQHTSQNTNQNTNTIDTSLDLTSNSLPPLPPQGGAHELASSGVVFSAGKLEVINGTKQTLLADFPGIDLPAVCNRAAKDAVQMADKSPDALLAVIRSHAQTQLELLAKRKRRAAAETGTRLPPDWRLPKALGDWALEEFRITEVQVRKEAGAFRDFWHSLPGNRGKKLDWAGTWRNWIGKNYKLKLEKADLATPRKSQQSQPTGGMDYDYLVRTYSRRPEGSG